MGSEEDLKSLPDQPPPPSARCVRDLDELINDNQKILFTRAQLPTGEEPPFYKVATMGGYINNGLPKTSELLTWETMPTPQRRNWNYRALASLGEIKVEFNGDPNWMADLYRLGTTLFLVSEPVLDLILEHDRTAIEISKPQIVGEHASRIAPYWVVMPCRVLDAVDITKSNILVQRPAIYRGATKFTTHVYFEKGFVFNNVPSDVYCFVEEFSSNWFWHERLIRAAASRGIHGLLFGYNQVKHISQEIRLRGPNDPSEW